MALYAFDGTWNSARLYDDQEQADETNVARFCEAYANDNRWYVPGPGTRYGRVGKIIGGVFGAGGFERVDAAYRQLCENYAAGDRIIDAVGFSRGAALVLDFAHRIRTDGIRAPNSDVVIEPRPPIRFLGLWDVIGSFGVPIGQLFGKINLGHKLYLPEAVEYCFHAMAMDERRQTFRVIRLLDAYEVWFRGVHSDVGGGNGNIGLSSIALHWMLGKAKGAGLPITEGPLKTALGAIDADAPLLPPTDFIVNEYRGFIAGDRFHSLVVHRPQHSNAPADAVFESAGDEARAMRLADLPGRVADVEHARLPVSESDLAAPIDD